MGKIRTAIGLMSGTSMDGIDVALLRTDGEALVERGPFLGVAYDTGFRDCLKVALEQAKVITERQQRPGELAAIERELTLRHASAVREFLCVNLIDASTVDVVGFHGQTVLHRPDEALTVQLGDGGLLAREIGITVACDLRANDMRHGGQGAPLVPVYHAALARNLRSATLPVCFVNIGGISNLTYIGADGAILGYDSGPGNTLIDQWVETYAGIPFDQGGMIASEGRVIAALADRYLNSPFFTSDKRRSLDRNDFPPPLGSDAELADGARTLAYVAAASIIKSASHLPVMPTLYVVCGGGRLNRILMQDLADLARNDRASVISAEAAGFNGDSMEAEAWAYLAVRSLDGLPLTFPGTTGVREPVSGGVLAPSTS